MAVVLPILGSLFDAGSYRVAFLLAACLPLAGTIVWTLLVRIFPVPAES
jgi:hypothetical protein